jgi:uncharacterized membrane protein
MNKQNKSKMAFTRMNYTLMLIGIAVIFLGFFIMTQDKETYGFGFLGITLGPLIVVAGFIIQFFAIFYKPGKNK